MTAGIGKKCCVPATAGHKPVAIWRDSVGRSLADQQITLYAREPEQNPGLICLMKQLNS